MEEELEHIAGIRGVAKASRIASAPSSMSPSQLLPDPELLEPSNRKKYLDHLIQVQYPALRDLAAKMLEGGCFLLDPTDLAFAIVERLTVEVDDYNDKQPYWDWVRGIAAASMHEQLQSLEEDDAASQTEEALTSRMVVGDRDLRRAFNNLSLERRRALYTVAVLGCTIEEAASRLGVEAEEVRKLGREGLKEIYGELKDEMQRIRDERTLGHQERGNTHGQ